MKVILQAETEDEAKFFRTGGIDLEERRMEFPNLSEVYICGRNMVGQFVHFRHAVNLPLEAQMSNLRLFLDILETARQMSICQEAIKQQVAAAHNADLAAKVKADLEAAKNGGRNIRIVH